MVTYSWYSPPQNFTELSCKRLDASNRFSKKCGHGLSALKVLTKFFHLLFSSLALNLADSSAHNLRHSRGVADVNTCA